MANVQIKTAKPNLKLLESQNKLHNRIAIESLYEAQCVIQNLMLEENDTAKLKEYNLSLEQIEFALQFLWGWEQDASMHRFWLRPKCICPKIDNEERRGIKSAGFIRVLTCPLHGN